MELTPIQRDILTALINIYRLEGKAVKGEKIAELMDRNPGTIRNQMQSLKSLNLVEGVAGPKGGYRATSAAYAELSLDLDEKDMAVPIVRNGAIVENTSASEIIFNKIMRLNICQGMIRIIGNIRDFREGDYVEVGPTPFHKLYIKGKVAGRDDAMSRVIMDITEIVSIPKVPVEKVAHQAVRIDQNASIQEASCIMMQRGVQEILVDDTSPGLVNLADITRAVAEGNSNQEIKSIMSHDFITIDSQARIYEAIMVLGKTGAKQLVVSKEGVLWGIIAPKDVIKSLNSNYS
jgi:predicted transcriptional regulator